MECEQGFTRWRKKNNTRWDLQEQRSRLMLPADSTDDQEGMLLDNPWAYGQYPHSHATIIPTSQMTRLRVREVKWQSCMEPRSWCPNSGPCDPMVLLSV